jgi:transcriptional regulator with XRE-family HTH domain
MEISSMPTLGKFIRRRRAELGLTQEELAERVGEGVRQSEISRLENDRVILPRRQRLESIAEALDVPIGVLLARSGWAGAEQIEWEDGEADPRKVTMPVKEAATGLMLESVVDVIGGIRNDLDDVEALRNGLPVPTRREQLQQIARALEVPPDAFPSHLDRANAASSPREGLDRHRPAAEGGVELLEVTNARLEARNGDLVDEKLELLDVVRELRTIREDLQVHSLELQLIAIAGDSARNQLRAALDGVEDGVIVVDTSGRIVLQNAAYTEILASCGTDAVMVDEHGNRLSDEANPFSRAARGDAFSLDIGFQTPGNVKWYIVHGKPISTELGGHLGIITFQDCPDTD